MADKWRKLICKKIELQLKGTLDGGQSFRWRKNLVDGEEQWTGIFASKVWILKQEEDCIAFKTYSQENNIPVAKKSKLDVDDETLLIHYFQLQLNLAKFYEQWSDADENFKQASQKFYGIRILKQEVIENIFAFICSSNNNIKRISTMVEKLATFYGPLICSKDDHEFYAFPSVEALAGTDVEQKLREYGFGYRAKYISKAAQHILENGGLEWIEKLKVMTYQDAKQTLMLLPGIGAKVADCICLMSLGHLGAIPVDTHIYQIAVRYYLPKLKVQKSLNNKIYEEIGDHFRNLYGPLAGWAHTVLFCADLKKFQKEK